MRRNYLKSSVLFIGCLIFLFSCREGDDSAPEIMFISPTEAQYLDIGHTLTVDIDVWDDQLVSFYEIDLESAQGFEYFHDEKVVNKTKHNINYEFDLPHNHNGEITIKLVVMDNEGNKSKSDISIFID